MDVRSRPDDVPICSDAKIEVLITIPMNPLENIIRIITHINIPKNPPNKI